MKKYFLLAFACFSLFACSRKTVPSKGTNGTIVNGNKSSATTINNNTNNSITNEPANNVTDTPSAVNNANAFSFMVITDGYGRIITQKDSLPTNANVQYNQFELSKGFSAQQLSNLKARYKTIPPRVLYVDPSQQINSVRGTYYILAKKFWYWKKKDGLFYLDEKYYL